MENRKNSDNLEGEQNNYNSNAQTIIMDAPSHKTFEEAQGQNTQSHGNYQKPGDL